MVTLSQLESHLWEAANILRGPVDAADFKTYVFPLLFFKRISDVHDEEYQAALAESGGDEEYALFPAELPLPDSRGLPLERCARGGDQRRPGAADGHARHREGEPGNALRHLRRCPVDQQGPPARIRCSAISSSTSRRITLGNQAAQADILGQSYEYLIKKFADATNKKAGEFYTPRSSCG